VASPLIHERERRRVSEAGDPEALRLLIVDDEPNYCAWLFALTRRLGFAIEIAHDGESALERLAERAFDIAVIDLEMPRINGIDLITRIRAQDSTKMLYALMLTGRSEIETKLTALAAGFDDFLGKSSPEAEIVAKLTAARRIAARQRMLDTTVRELYGLATRDELTGVFNRRFFVGETERLLAARAIVNVVLFDLDEFKVVNDTYGHLAGDRVLRDVGALFHRHTRPEDLIARYGGDEFVLVVPHLMPDEIERVATRLANDVRALQWSTDREPFSLDVTIGFASSALLAQPALEQLLEAADRDLYKNKWLRRHPAERAELYVYPTHEQPIALVPPAGARRGRSRFDSR
jgi:two-component system cell cycle response regulator